MLAIGKFHGLNLPQINVLIVQSFVRTIYIFFLNVMILIIDNHICYSLLSSLDRYNIMMNQQPTTFCNNKSLLSVDLTNSDPLATLAAKHLHYMT